MVECRECGKLAQLTFNGYCPKCWNRIGMREVVDDEGREKAKA